jgi:23S rRNA (pseudouridine1915-N3)-methyltransferase
LNTIEFSNQIQRLRNDWENIIYIIGGSYGIDIELLNTSRKHILMNLSPLVMPHGLAYLVLIEQVYRALEIIKWSGYHHI